MLRRIQGGGGVPLNPPLPVLNCMADKQGTKMFLKNLLARSRACLTKRTFLGRTLHFAFKVHGKWLSSRLNSLVKNLMDKNEWNVLNINYAFVLTSRPNLLNCCHVIGSMDTVGHATKTACIYGVQCYQRRVIDRLSENHVAILYGDNVIGVRRT